MSEQPVYRIKPKFKEQHPNAVTLVNGVGVVLADGDLTVEIPGTLSAPPRVRQYRAATQADLAYLFEVEKNPAIEIAPPERKKSDKAAGKSEAKDTKETSSDTTDTDQ